MVVVTRLLLQKMTGCNFVSCDSTNRVDRHPEYEGVGFAFTPGLSRELVGDILTSFMQAGLRDAFVGWLWRYEGEVWEGSIVEVVGAVAGVVGVAGRVLLVVVVVRVISLDVGVVRKKLGCGLHVQPWRCRW